MLDWVRERLGNWERVGLKKGERENLHVQFDSCQLADLDQLFHNTHLLVFKCSSMTTHDR